MIIQGREIVCVIEDKAPADQLDTDYDVCKNEWVVGRFDYI